MSAMRELMQKWWISRYDIVHIGINVKLSGLYLSFIVLDYGVKFSIELPYGLNKANVVNYLIGQFLRLVLWTDRRACFPYRYLAFNVGKTKAVELEIMGVDEIVGLDYRWTAHTDHWGHRLHAAVAGVWLSAELADGRHWDREKNAPVS